MPIFSLVTITKLPHHLQPWLEITWSAASSQTPFGHVGLSIMCTSPSWDTQVRGVRGVGGRVRGMGGHVRGVRCEVWGDV